MSTIKLNKTKTKTKTNRKKKKTTRVVSRPRKNGKREFSAVRMGQRIGSVFGPKGSRIGAEAGRLFRSVTGFGDYQVQSNSLLTAMDRLPSFRSMSSGTRIMHREYLGDVITSSTPGAFKLQSFPVQPALLSTFPWLSATAENFQEYRANGIVYEFKSNSYNALASTNTASGTVVMATNYNVLEPNYATKFLMEQSQYACSDKPSNHLLHPIECAKIETPTSILYTRSGTITSGDLRLYDWCNFQIATVGMQGASTNIGELWVTYDITLLKPRLGSSVDVYDHYIIPPGDVTYGQPAKFGQSDNPPPKSPESDMGTQLVSFTPDNVGYDGIAWPSNYVGNVLVLYCIPCVSVAGASLNDPLTITYAGNASYINFIGGVNNSTEAGGVFVYNGQGCTTFATVVRLNGGGAIRLTGGTTSAPPISADLYIVALPANFEASLVASSVLTLPKLHSSSKTITIPLETKMIPRHIGQSDSDFDELDVDNHLPTRPSSKISNRSTRKSQSVKSTPPFSFGK